jgi:hypothetical protein
MESAFDLIETEMGSEAGGGAAEDETAEKDDGVAAGATCDDAAPTFMDQIPRLTPTRQSLHCGEEYGQRRHALDNYPTAPLIAET